MKKGRWVWLVLLAGPLQAQPSLLTLPELLSKITEQQQSLRTLKVNVHQQVRHGSAAAPEVQGELVWQKPFHLRFSEASPERQVIISDGNQIWLFTPAAKQQLVGSWSGWVHSARLPLPLVDFLTGVSLDRLQEHYGIIYGGLDQGLYRLMFKPKAAQALPMTLWFSPVSYFPMKGILESRDSVLEWNIVNLQLNPTVSDTLFQPTVPRGTAIVPWNF